MFLLGLRILVPLGRLWFVLVPGVALAALGRPVADPHRQFLQHFEKAYSAALVEGRIEPLAPFLKSEDLRFMPITQPTTLGRANVEAYFHAFFTRFAVQTCARASAGQFDLGPRVVEVGRFTQRLVHRSSGEAFELNGKYLEVWEKESDGSLRWVTSAWNSDERLAQAEWFRFPEVPSVRTAFAARAPINSETSLELAALGYLHEAAVVQHDVELWGRLFADDAIVLANQGPLVVGRGQVDEYLASHRNQLPIFEKLDLRIDRIEEFETYVFEYCSQVATWRNGEWSGVSTGKNLRIWRREPGRTLKIVLSIGSYD